MYKVCDSSCHVKTFHHQNLLVNRLIKKYKYKYKWAYQPPPWSIALHCIGSPVTKVIYICKKKYANEFCEEGMCLAPGILSQFIFSSYFIWNKWGAPKSFGKSELCWLWPKVFDRCSFFVLFLSEIYEKLQKKCGKRELCWLWPQLAQVFVRPLHRNFD